MANYCPNCGNQVNNGDMYCSNCGNSLSGGANYTNTSTSTAGDIVGTLVAVSLASGITRELYFHHGRYFLDPYCRHPFGGPRVLGHCPMGMHPPRMHGPRGGAPRGGFGGPRGGHR